MPESHDNRLAVGLARARRIPIEVAEAMLSTLTLKLVASEACLKAVSFQAALLTAFNAANRAFLGGVCVEMPDEVPLLLPLAGMRTLNEALNLTGFQSKSISNPTEVIYFGDSLAESSGTRLDCDAWRAAVCDSDKPSDFGYGDGDVLPLGGIFGAGLALHRAFLKAVQIPARSLDGPFGLSLWQPSESWQNPISKPQLQQFPSDLWLLGLGHLGQAFLWNLALLPYPDPSRVRFLLHDFDGIEKENMGSGLLSTVTSIGQKKSRHCAGWLEAQGFTTTIVERPYGVDDRVGEDSPKIALCGFDRATPRRSLSTTGFDLIVECGLGGTLADFDRIDLHDFPFNRQTPEEIWFTEDDAPVPVDEATQSLFGRDKLACGQVLIDRAGKAASTSFVGAMAGAIAVSELLRIFNRGTIHERMIFWPRTKEDCQYEETSKRLTASKLGTLGFILLPKQ